MKFIDTHVKNFKNIEDIPVYMNGHSVLVTGGNGKGKSSYIDAEFILIGAMRAPKKAIMDGKDKATIKGKIGDGITDNDILIERTFTEAYPNGKLSVKLSNGAYSDVRAQEYLDQTFGRVYFDIGKLLHAKNEKEALQYINDFLGIDMEPIDGLIKAEFDERTIINRKVKELKAVVTSTEPTEDEKTVFVKGPVDITELNKKQVEKVKLQGEKTALEGRITTGKNLKKATETEIDLLYKRINELHAEMTEKKAKVVQCNNGIESLEKDLKQIVIPNEDYSSQIDSAVKTNEKVNKVKLYNDNVVALETVTKESEGKTKAIEDAREKKQKMYEAAKLGNISITEDGLLYKNLPLQEGQINTAALAELAVDVIIAVDPVLRTVRFDASVMDHETYSSVCKKLDEAGFQKFVERVDVEGGELTIQVIED